MSKARRLLVAAAAVFRPWRHTVADYPPGRRKATSCFRWLPELFALSEEDTLRKAGFDAFMFLRLAQLSARFCFFAFIPCGIPLLVVGSFPHSVTQLRSYTIALPIQPPCDCHGQGNSGAETRAAHRCRRTHRAAGATTASSSP